MTGYTCVQLLTVVLTQRDCSVSMINAKALENTEGTAKKGQSRETGNIGYTRRRNTKQKHNAICVGHHYEQTHTDNVNKTQVLLQTTGGDI